MVYLLMDSAIESEGVPTRCGPPKIKRLESDRANRFSRAIRRTLLRKQQFSFYGCVDVQQGSDMVRDCISVSRRLNGPIPCFLLLRVPPHSLAMIYPSNM